MIEDNIYTLILNETVLINGFNITRVPGGWIYQKTNPFNDASSPLVFIPYNEEFIESNS